MILKKVIHEKKDAPLADLPFSLKIRARAWTIDEERTKAGRLVSAAIHVQRRHARNAFLLAHEAAHAVRDEDNATMHHDWWHFCGCVGHAIRITRACLFTDLGLTSAEIADGEILAAMEDGQFVAVP